MEREHVSILMCRKLCGCKSTRIDDEAEKVGNEPSSSYPSAETSSVSHSPTKDSSTPICVIIASPRILSRGILGVLISNLEEKSLRTLDLSLVFPSSEQLKTLNGRKFGPSTFPVSVSAWTGIQVYDRVRQATNDFIQRFALEKADIYSSDNKSRGKRDYFQTWFPSNPTITTQPVAGLASIVEIKVPISNNDEGLLIKTNSMDKEMDDDRKIVEETGKEDELVEDLGEAYPENGFVT
ncbi:unnamed protein product, partial [Mesorhabditis belari]|uniref:Uncharacterized protein n=1 Tax=Mesorhabditis belari TaxID=2138241 RepID=A0AAF3F5K7_9BILA